MLDIDINPKHVPFIFSLVARCAHAGRKKDIDTYP